MQLPGTMRVAAGGVGAQALTTARFLLIFVRDAIQARVAQAREGTVFLEETEILAWRTLLSQAALLAEQFLAAGPVLVPPVVSALVHAAVSNIQNALRILERIPVIRPLIFPPRPGGADVSVVLLAQIQSLVAQAAQDLQEAESRLAVP